MEYCSPSEKLKIFLNIWHEMERLKLLIIHRKSPEKITPFPDSPGVDTTFVSTSGSNSKPVMFGRDTFKSLCC